MKNKVTLGQFYSLKDMKYPLMVVDISREGVSLCYPDGRNRVQIPIGEVFKTLFVTGKLLCETRNPSLGDIYASRDTFNNVTYVEVLSCDSDGKISLRDLSTKVIYCFDNTNNQIYKHFSYLGFIPREGEKFRHEKDGRIVEYIKQLNGYFLLKVINPGNQRLKKSGVVYYQPIRSFFSRYKSYIEPKGRHIFPMPKIDWDILSNFSEQEREMLSAGLPLSKKLSTNFTSPLKDDVFFDPVFCTYLIFIEGDKFAPHYDRRRVTLIRDYPNRLKYLGRLPKQGQQFISYIGLDVVEVLYEKEGDVSFRYVPNGDRERMGLRDFLEKFKPVSPVLAQQFGRLLRPKVGVTVSDVNLSPSPSIPTIEPLAGKTTTRIVGEKLNFFILDFDHSAKAPSLLPQVGDVYKSKFHGIEVTVIKVGKKRFTVTDAHRAWKMGIFAFAGQWVYVRSEK